MNCKEAGSIGGKVTQARYGVEDIRCPVDGTLCEKRTTFHEDNGRKGGLKGIRVMQARYSEEQRREWCRRGGRPRNE